MNLDDLDLTQILEKFCRRSEVGSIHLPPVGEGRPGRSAGQTLLEAAEGFGLEGWLGRRGRQGGLEATEEVGKEFVVSVAVADRQRLKKKKKLEKNYFVLGFHNWILLFLFLHCNI